MCHYLPGRVTLDSLDADIRTLSTRCIVCAGRDPQDPEYPRLKPVGVYPVEEGWAHINLKDVAGKGEDGYSALYVVPGEGVRIVEGLCGCQDGLPKVVR